MTKHSLTHSLCHPCIRILYIHTHTHTHTHIHLHTHTDTKALHLTRYDFEARACVGVFARALSPVDRVLESNSMRKEEIDEVVMVGGTTRIPKVVYIHTDTHTHKTIHTNTHTYTHTHNSRYERC